jgi:hypothetical protein
VAAEHFAIVAKGVGERRALRESPPTEIAPEHVAATIAGLYGLEFYPHPRTILERLGAAAAARHGFYLLDLLAVPVFGLEA